MNYTYRIYPTAEQQALMRSWLETCRHLYNRCLRDLKDWIASRKCSLFSCSLNREYIMSPDIPFPSYLEQKKQLTQWKKENPYYKDVYSQVTQDVVKRLHNTWSAFKARGFGFPRYKKYGSYQSFLFPQLANNPISGATPRGKPAQGREGDFKSKRCPQGSQNRQTEKSPPGAHQESGNTIKLPKIGEVVINQHRPIPEGFKVKGVRIVSRARGTIWYAVVTIQCDVNVPDPVPFGRGIGIDIGLESFLVTSDNFRVEPSVFFRELQSRLKVLQRRASRKNKRSKNWEKAQIKVARLHHQISNTRKNFHFQTSHLLCDQADMIFVESPQAPLNKGGIIRGDARGFLGKQMLDGGFGQFRDLLSWVCGKRGKYFSQVDHRHTSQICPECGTHTGKKELSERVHICDECGYQTTRDHASGRVILNRGLSKVVPMDCRERKLSGKGVLSGVLYLDKCRSRNANSRGLEAVEGAFKQS